MPKIKDVLEAEIEDYLCDRVCASGGETRKLKYVGRRGAPDRLVLLRGVVGFAELKRPRGGRPSANQSREIKRLSSLGLIAEILKNKEEVDKFIERMLDVRPE